MRRTVKADERDPVLDVSDQCVENGIQLPVIIEMASSRAASLDDDGHGQRLRVGILIERDMLRNAVVGDQEIVRRESKHYLSGFVGHQDRNHHQGSAYG